MPGKPYQSKLRSYHDEIFSLLDAGTSYRQVAQALNRKYGLGVTHNAVGTIKRGSRLLPSHPALRRFETLVLQAWAPTVNLVEEARHRHASRRAENERNGA